MLWQEAFLQSTMGQLNKHVKMPDNRAFFKCFSEFNQVPVNYNYAQNGRYFRFLSDVESGET